MCVCVSCLNQDIGVHALAVATTCHCRRGCPKDMRKEQVAQYRPTVMDSANML